MENWEKRLYIGPVVDILELPKYSFFDTVDNPKFATSVPDLIFCILLFLITLFYYVFVYVNTLALG